MNFKKRLIGYLERFELYFKFKYSRLVYGFLKWKNPRLKEVLKSELELGKEVLSEMKKDEFVFDIGANLGYSIENFLKFTTNIIAVEPNIINVNCLKGRYGSQKNIRVLQKAVSDKEGVANIYLQDNGDSLHTLSMKWKNFLEGESNDRWQEKLTFSKSSKINTTTLDQLIDQFGLPYYIKIDVEGLEEKVIKGLSQKVPLVSFEANLPEFIDETIRSVNHLSVISNTSKFNYSMGTNLELDEYVSNEKFNQLLKNANFRCIDVFCKM